ncbi:hypothetical protein MJO52_12870 [Microbulbifer variabilis]|uniref:Uncharacterized protein n=1 Tax=Microbulbifer variabilis TaxID=266805 RepID=A0ABY4V992_9GAMM|nr:hypothetical protein [Microbulbifer variabilis]USD19971.1 hypothetical protein MJO52_12870 [Microbulbifer variabilis]
MKYVLFFILLIFHAQASAAWIYNTKIVDVRWYTDYGFITVEDDDATQCPGAQPTKHKRLLNDNDGGDEKIISMALAAMMANKKIDLNVKGCFTDEFGKEYPLVTGIVVKS